MNNQVRNAFSLVSRHGASLATPARQFSVLLPLLVLYLVVVLFASSPDFQGDEGGYAGNAIRMVHGPAVSPHDLRLWWGPGYPLVLVPFVLLGLPWIAAKLLNAVFLFGAITYFYALLKRYIPGPAALIATLCLGLYPPLMREVHHLSSENLTFLLMCGFMFHFCALYNGTEHSRLNLLGASMYAAYLALTKVFFGYVIAAVLTLSLVLLIWRQMRATRIAISVFAMALAWCIPYLWYTYSLTGKVFYWATAGGSALYWMSTPYANEYGSWFSDKDAKERPELVRHRDFFAMLDKLSDIDRDDALKRRAISNITHHPGKYLVNWLANIGRLLFSYPFSFASQSLSTYFYLAPNIFIVVLFVISVIPAVLRPGAIPIELWALLVFVLIAFGGSTLLAAYDRQFRPLVPGVCVWLAFVYVRLLRIEVRSSEIADCPIKLEPDRDQVQTSAGDRVLDPSTANQ
jgi:hypothetical protein